MPQEEFCRYPVLTDSENVVTVVPAPPPGTARLVKYAEFFNRDNKPHTCLFGLQEGVTTYLIRVLANVAAGGSDDVPIEHGAYVLKPGISFGVVLSAGATTESHVTAHCVTEHDPNKAALFGVHLDLTEDTDQVVIVESPPLNFRRVVGKVTVVNADNTPSTYKLGINDGSTIWLQESSTLTSLAADEHPHRGGAFVMHYGDTMEIALTAAASSQQCRVTTHWVDEPEGVDQ